MDVDIDPRFASHSGDFIPPRPTVNSCWASAIVLLIGVLLAGSVFFGRGGSHSSQPSSQTITASGTSAR